MQHTGKKEMKVRVPAKETITKLEDLINVELKTIEYFLDEAVRVKQELAKIVDGEYAENILTAYDQKISETLYHKHIDSLVAYVSLLAYARALSDNGKLFAYEDNWGNMQITYQPYLLKINNEK